MALNWKSTVSLLDLPKPAAPLPVARPCLPAAANFKDFCFVWTPSPAAPPAPPAGKQQQVKAQPDLAAMRAQAIMAQQRQTALSAAVERSGGGACAASTADVKVEVTTM